MHLLTSHKRQQNVASKQHAARQRERIAEKRRKVNIPRPCSKTPLQPFGKIPADFWMLFFMNSFEDNWDLLLM